MSAQLWTYRASLVRVVDGDSLLADLDLGFFVTLRQPIRLLGIDAPELHSHDPTAAALAARAKRRLAELVPLEFVLRTHAADASDKFGRWLGEILLPDGRTANEILLSEGLARPYAGGARGVLPA